jgi:uncharacterized protein with GYD domain
MAKYVSLINWTDEGAKNAGDTVDRAEAAGELAAEMGGSFQAYWTMGSTTSSRSASSPTTRRP